MGALARQPVFGRNSSFEGGLGYRRGTPAGVSRGSLAALGTGQAMAAILHDGGSDLRELGALMAAWLGVVASRVVAAARSNTRPAIDDGSEFCG